MEKVCCANCNGSTVVARKDEKGNYYQAICAICLGFGIVHPDQQHVSGIEHILNTFKTAAANLNHSP